jgi:CelD/BcsL family acetyltransferase involved in cellulose biosynthesis
LKTRLVPIHELGERDLRDWRELAGRALDPNPFFDPDFVLPATRGLGVERHVGILVVEDAGGWRACLPIRRQSRWQHLPLPCVAAWVHEYCLLGSPLVLGEGAPEALGAAVEAMRTMPGCAFVALPWVAGDGPLAAALADAVPEPIAYDSWHRATVRRRPGEDHLAGRVKGKHRRDFHRLARGLQEDLGAPLELVDRSTEPGAVDAFLRLEAAGWKGRAGTAVASVPAHAEFVREATARFAARGDLRLLFLEADDHVAAARLSLRAGDSDFCFKVAYDEGLARFSPGRELELRLLERLGDEVELASMDSCTAPDNELYNRLWPDRRRLATLAYRSPAALGRAAGPGLRAMASLRDRRRRNRAAER